MCVVCGADESGLGTAGSTGYGFHSLAAPVALRDARIGGVDEVCPEGGHVLLGGNLESCGILPQLVKNLRRDYFPCVRTARHAHAHAHAHAHDTTRAHLGFVGGVQRKIVLMEPTEPSEDVWQRIAAFPDVYVLLVPLPHHTLPNASCAACGVCGLSCAVCVVRVSRVDCGVQGNTTEAADLRRAGADRAHSVILLSPWKEEHKYPHAPHTPHDTTRHALRTFLSSEECRVVRRKSKKSKKGDTGVAPYTSIMKVQQVLKDELRSTVRTLLCVGKNHKGTTRAAHATHRAGHDMTRHDTHRTRHDTRGSVLTWRWWGHTGTAKELTPAQREHQTINHPLHASSLMMAYDLFDYWLAKVP
jgi:hypothetical protein